MTKKKLGYTLTLVIFLALAAGAFYLASVVTQNEELQMVVSELGVAGIIISAFLAGLNTFIPVHIATLAPLFMESGASYLTVVLCFTLGASLADSVSYFIGRLGRKYSQNNDPKFSKKIEGFFEHHRKLVMPLTYLYMAFAPLPNEYIMIPLALAGYKLPRLIIPLVLGNFIHFNLTVFGYATLFDWLIK